MKNESKTQNDLAALLWSNTVESKDLQKALLNLSLPSQRMLFLRFWESMTIEEIADEMRMTWDAADLAINNALAALRKNMLGRKSKNHSVNGAA